eukprot:RCo000966
MDENGREVDPTHSGGIDRISSEPPIQDVPAPVILPTPPTTADSFIQSQSLIPFVESADFALSSSSAASSCFRARGSLANENASWTTSDAGSGARNSLDSRLDATVSHGSITSALPFAGEDSVLSGSSYGKRSTASPKFQAAVSTEISHQCDEDHLSEEACPRRGVDSSLPCQPPEVLSGTTNELNPFIPSAAKITRCNSGPPTTSQDLSNPSTAPSGTGLSYDDLLAKATHFETQLKQLKQLKQENESMASCLQSTQAEVSQWQLQGVQLKRSLHRAKQAQSALEAENAALRTLNKDMEAAVHRMAVQLRSYERRAAEAEVDL